MKAAFRLTSKQSKVKDGTYEIVDRKFILENKEKRACFRSCVSFYC